MNIFVYYMNIQYCHIIKFCLLTSTVFRQFCYIINAGPQLWLLHMLCKWAHCTVYSLWCDIAVFCSQYSLDPLTLYTTAHNVSAQVLVLWTAKNFTKSLASISSRLCLTLFPSANSYHIQTNRHSMKPSTHILWMFNKSLLYFITTGFL